MAKAIVTGGFDDLRSSDYRFLEEAAKQGDLFVFLWTDDLVRNLGGVPPKFPLEERMYLLQAVRSVKQVQLVDQLADRDGLPEQVERSSGTWVVKESDDNRRKRSICDSYGLKYLAVKKGILQKYPKHQNSPSENRSTTKKVVVTGCYDWFHSGHVRFFEEVSGLGDLYVIVGSDRNVGLLKGAGHPMFPQEERRYIVQSIRFVRQALISSGTGWMDGEPEIARIKPDIYAVNEDGDQPEKRSFCKTHGIHYMVLERKPKEGLPKRQSVDLRGF